MAKILVITKPTNDCYIRQVETNQLYNESTDIGYFGSDKQYHPKKYTYESTEIIIEDEQREEIDN